MTDAIHFLKQHVSLLLENKYFHSPVASDSNEKRWLNTSCMRRKQIHLHTHM